MVAYVYRMGNGVAGDISRQSAAHIEPQVLGATPFPAYGRFGKMVSNKFVPIGAADVAASVYGLFLRPYPTQGANANDPLGTAVPATSGMADVLRRGYALVKSNAGTPGQGTQVYIRAAAGTANQPIGGVEATADGTNTIAVTGAKFTGAADAAGVAEIEFNI